MDPADEFNNASNTTFLAGNDTPATGNMFPWIENAIFLILFIMLALYYTNRVDLLHRLFEWIHGVRVVPHGDYVYEPDYQIDDDDERWGPRYGVCAHHAHELDTFEPTDDEEYIWDSEGSDGTETGDEEESRA